MQNDKAKRKMSKYAKFRLSFKFWIEFEGKRVLGKGGAAILDYIKKEGSISTAAKKLGMSYRYVWGYLNEIGKTVGEPVVATSKGGKGGGGSARLTELGEYLLSKYKRIYGAMEDFVSGETLGSKMSED